MGEWEGLGASKGSSRGPESPPELLTSSQGYHGDFQAQESVQRAVPLKATLTISSWWVGRQDVEPDAEAGRQLGTCHHCPGDRQGLSALTRPRASAGSRSLSDGGQKH